MPPKKILITGNDEHIFSLLRILFQAKGCEVLELTDSKSVLEVASKESPNIVLIDVALPRTTGLDLCISLKNEPTTRQIIIAVLDTDRSQSKIWKNAGADLYLSKPFNSSELTTSVLRILEPQF